MAFAHTCRAMIVVLALLSFLATGLAAHAQNPPAAAGTAGGDNSATELAKKLQNPIGDLYSFPFQGNTNFDTGTKGGTQEILNVQPVIPIHINDDLTLITRTILPLVWQPSYRPTHVVPFGTAPIDFSALLSNANPIDHFVFGTGPIIQVPTISNKTLGSNVWGAGPEAVAVYIQGPWVAGLLVNSIFSFSRTDGRGGTHYRKLLIEPFVNYNFGEGWYVFSAPNSPPTGLPLGTTPGPCRSAVVAARW